MGDVFLAGLVLTNRRCVVLGDDHEADDKAARLAAAGARVEVVAPAPSAALRALARDEPRVVLVPGPLADELAYCEGAALVVLAPRDEARAARLYARAIAPGGFLLCAIDQPSHCTFVNLATVRRGALQLAIGTAGRAPALAAALRRALDAQLGDDVARFVDALAALRERTAPTLRRAVLREALEGLRFELRYALPSLEGDRDERAERSKLPGDGAGGTPST